ncbi:MAG: HD domain-containing protein [Lentisphaeria bacterium]|nr:HD domain-containing protein [Lentisphaeria bacterium]
MDSITSYTTFRTFVDQLLISAEPHKKLRALAHAGILKRFFPELDALRGVEQPKRWHPEGDVFEHTMLMLSRMAWKTPLLGWCILLHDIGKKAAQTFDKDEVPHFYGHEALGADMCRGILERYDFDENTIRRIENAVRTHMSFTNLKLMRKKKQLRLLEREDFDLHLELHRLDCICSNGILENYLLLLDLKQEAAQNPPPPPPLLTGKDLLSMGLTPGPVFSEILHQTFIRQCSGKIKNRQEAIQYVKTILA